VGGTSCAQKSTNDEGETKRKGGKKNPQAIEKLWPFEDEKVEGGKMYEGNQYAAPKTGLRDEEKRKNCRQREYQLVTRVRHTAQPESSGVKGTGRVNSCGQAAVNRSATEYSIKRKTKRGEGRGVCAKDLTVSEGPPGAAGRGGGTQERKEKIA